MAKKNKNLTRKARKKLNAARAETEKLRADQVDQGKRMVQQMSPAVLQQLVMRQAMRRKVGQ